MVGIVECPITKTREKRQLRVEKLVLVDEVGRGVERHVYNGFW